MASGASQRPGAPTLGPDTEAATAERHTLVPQATQPMAMWRVHSNSQGRGQQKHQRTSQNRVQGPPVRGRSRTRSWRTGKGKPFPPDSGPPPPSVPLCPGIVWAPRCPGEPAKQTSRILTPLKSPLPAPRISDLCRRTDRATSQVEDCPRGGVRPRTVCARLLFVCRERGEALQVSSPDRSMSWLLGLKGARVEPASGLVI